MNLHLKSEQTEQDTEIALDVLIDFIAEAPVFILNNLDVPTLTCTLSDIGWSLQLPAIDTVDS